MAQISSNILQGLSSPSFGRGMFSVGEAIGGIPGQMKAKKKQDKFNEIMKRGQAVMASAEPDPVVLSGIAQELSALGYTKEAQQFADASRNRGLQAAQRARVGGLLTQAGTRAGITPEFAQQYVDSGGTLEELSRGREAGKQFAEPRLGRGRGELKAMAMQPGFDPTNPKMLEAYKGIARAYGVSPSEAMDILSKERGTQAERAKIRSTKAGRAGTTTFAGGDKYLDKRGLEYRLTEVRDPTGEGEVRTEYQPVGHEIPYAFTFKDKEGNDIQNRLTEKGGAYGETAAERTERFEAEKKISSQLDITKATTIEEAKDFNKQKIKAAERLTAVNQGLEKVDAMLQIVDGLNTGSTLDQMMDLVQTALGYRETDRGVFEKLALQLVADNIKTYGSNPSDGERAAVQAMLPSLENTSGINRKILEMARGRFAKERAAINYIQQEGMTLEKYVKFVDGLYPTAEDGVDPATGNKVVDFNDI
jgi:hypothetical protein